MNCEGSLYGYFQRERLVARAKLNISFLHLISTRLNRLLLELQLCNGEITRKQFENVCLLKLQTFDK